MPKNSQKPKIWKSLQKEDRFQNWHKFFPLTVFCKLLNGQTKDVFRTCPLWKAKHYMLKDLYTDWLVLKMPYNKWYMLKELWFVLFVLEMCYNKDTGSGDKNTLPWLQVFHVFANCYHILPVARLNKILYNIIKNSGYLQFWMS